MELKTNQAITDGRAIENGEQGLEEYKKILVEVSGKIDYDVPESSINLPFDQEMQKEISEKIGKFNSSKLRYVLVVGMGGSSLGAKAIYESLLGFFDFFEQDRFPKAFFIDGNSNVHLEKLVSFLKGKIDFKEEIVINIISKSGQTTETLASAEILIQSLLSKFPDLKERIVITTAENSPLHEVAKNEGMETLFIPTNIPGRFSFFSPVGLFPSGLLGIDINKLLEGAREMRKRCLDDGSPAVASAVVLYENMRQGKRINDNFFFYPELESLGKWYRQLMAESIGKEKDREGNKINAGITPTVSIGPGDLHSVGQLYLGGPKDKITTFIWSPLPGLTKVEGKTFGNIMPAIVDKNYQDIMGTILDGVKIAYQKQGLPFMEIIMNDIGPKSIGEFLQFKMIEIMYLGKLLNINSFDQPGVESYKIETRRILEEN